MSWCKVQTCTVPQQPGKFLLLIKTVWYDQKLQNRRASRPRLYLSLTASQTKAKGDRKSTAEWGWNQSSWEMCCFFGNVFNCAYCGDFVMCYLSISDRIAKPTTTARGKANKKTGDAREWGKHTRCEIKNLSVGVRRLKISWGINHSRRDTETCSDFDLSPSNLILHAAQLRPASPSGKSARLSIHLSWMFWWSSPNRITHTHTHTHRLNPGSEWTCHSTRRSRAKRKWPQHETFRPLWGKRGRLPACRISTHRELKDSAEDLLLYKKLQDQWRSN